MDQGGGTLYLNERELRIVTLILDMTGHRPRSRTSEDLSILGLPDGAHALTPRERQVLLLLLDGLSSAETAERLGISTATVNVHKVHAYGKLGVRRAIEVANLFASEQSRTALRMISGPRVPRGYR